MRILKLLSKNRKSKDINLEELNYLINLDKQAILLDVRSLQEFEEGHLKRCYKYTFI